MQFDESCPFHKRSVISALQNYASIMVDGGPLTIPISICVVISSSFVVIHLKKTTVEGLVSDRPGIPKSGRN